MYVTMKNGLSGSTVPLASLTWANAAGAAASMSHAASAAIDVLDFMTFSFDEAPL